MIRDSIGGILLKAVNIMIEEHENIRKILKVIRRYCYRVMNDDDIDYEDFYKIIDFIRNYSDGLHHAKEEDILFKILGEQVPKLANNGAITGMLIEHDLSRLYTSNLEKALEKYRLGNDEARLDIIANAIAYTDLLDRHIEKENNALYRFANNLLADDIKTEIDKRCAQVDLTAGEKGVQDKYLSFIGELEQKIK